MAPGSSISLVPDAHLGRFATRQGSDPHERISATVTADARKPLPPLRTRLQPFLDDIGSSRSAEHETLANWRPALKAAGPFRDTARWRAAVQVVRSAPGKLPPPDVTEQVGRVLAEREVAKDRVRAIAVKNRAEACDFIRATRARTGMGPLWRELAAHFGVTNPVDARVFIWHLRKIGAVQFTRERGSLDLADPATAAEEAKWRSNKWAQVIREHMAIEPSTDAGLQQEGDSPS